MCTCQLHFQSNAINEASYQKSSCENVNFRVKNARIFIDDINFIRAAAKTSEQYSYFDPVASLVHNYETNYAIRCPSAK